MEIAIAAALTEERKTQYVTYWGFAKIIKGLFELHITEPVSKTQEEIDREKLKEETVDWMERWLKDQAKELEKI
jgi:cob(I)alamin adenosyltransferase